MLQFNKAMILFADLIFRGFQFRKKLFNVIHVCIVQFHSIVLTHSLTFMYPLGNISKHTRA